MTKKATSNSGFTLNNKPQAAISTNFGSEVKLLEVAASPRYAVTLKMPPFALIYHKSALCHHLAQQISVIQRRFSHSALRHKLALMVGVRHV